jgi:hypothetical protein
LEVAGRDSRKLFVDAFIHSAEQCVAPGKHHAAIEVLADFVVALLNGTLDELVDADGVLVHGQVAYGGLEEHLRALYLLTAENEGLSVWQFELLLVRVAQFVFVVFGHVAGLFFYLSFKG